MRQFNSRFLVFSATLACVGVAASALYAAGASAESASSAIDIGAGVSAWMPVITVVANGVVGAVAAVAVWWLKAKWHVDIDAGHRAALQSALLNAAGLALNRLGNQLQGRTINAGNPALAGLANYVLRAAPNAIEHFGLAERLEEIEQKIIAKLPQVANTTAVSGNGDARA